MAQTDQTIHQSNEFKQGIAEARRRLALRANEQGVHPLRFEEMLGDESEADPQTENVDEFLTMLREWRNEPTRTKIG